jgi:cytosine/adenosine deaminase-related metal-dependent hydrolase
VTDETRKELIQYYKWIVSLATFVLTFSLGALGLRGTAHVSVLLVIGWSALVISIFFNLVLVKRLITLAIVASVPEEEREWPHELYLATLGNMKAYGLLQNGAFYVGVVLVVLGLALAIGSG